MTKLVVAHKNTETTIMELEEDFNKEVAWIVIHHDDGTHQHFFPNEKGEK